MRVDEKNIKAVDVIERQIEALLFVSTRPVSAEALAEHVGVSVDRAKRALASLKEYYEAYRGLALLNVAGGWQMATAPDLAETVESFSSFLSMQKIRLSRAALETLAVIAYSQPVTMSEIEEIRSVRCDRVVETLLRNGLIERPRRDNRKKSLRRYRTTAKFLEIFGLSAISDLPTLEELRDESSDEDAEAREAEYTRENEENAAEGNGEFLEGEAPRQNARAASFDTAEDAPSPPDEA